MASRVFCDPTARGLGLMPHPKTFNHPTNHPDWRRGKAGAGQKQVFSDQALIIGIRLFENAVDYIQGAV